MPTKEEIIERYQKYSDRELVNVYWKIEEYTDEGKEALMTVLDERGGIESLKNRVKKEIKIENEVSRIKVKIVELLNQEKNSLEIKENIVTNDLTSDEIQKTIEEVTIAFELEKADKKIKPRTILGSIIGGFIGGTIGGIVWGVQLIYSNRMFLLLLLGLGILSYAFIKLFTRQSTKNIIVLIMTIISVIYALVLGQLIFEVIGYVE